VSSFKYKDREYEIDADGFLLDFKKWDEQFAEGMAIEAAIEAGIEGGLTDAHWRIIHYIHDMLKKTGICVFARLYIRLAGITISVWMISESYFRAVAFGAPVNWPG